SMKQVGEVRSAGSVIMLTLITFGIYGLVWNYHSFEEIRRFRGKGVGGGAGVLLALFGIAPFLLGSYVGDMYADQKEDPPVSVMAEPSATSTQQAPNATQSTASNEPVESRTAPRMNGAVLPAE